jgi:uncharacterized 2Fe-2S/4Fe-4S cluster protein (DUF4445 family)
MREAELSVKFLPGGRTIFVLPGTRLMEAAVEAGSIVDSPCGGEGTCGKCRVRILSGVNPPTSAEERFFSPQELLQGWRLACQSMIETACEVEIPDASLLAARHQQICVTSETSSSASSDDPPIRKRYVELPLPSRGSDDPDLQRLEKAVGPFEINLKFAREMPLILRKRLFRGTAVVSEESPRVLLGFESENTENAIYAVALDVGTTTLAAQLLNLDSRSLGAELAVASRLNPQTRFGDDVLSRILFARESAENLQRLQTVIVEAVEEMIGELCRSAGVDREHVYGIAFAGNTAMQHLLLGVDPRSLGEVPFVPAIAQAMSFDASELGLAIHPRGRAFVFPSIGGFVGGDTTAGVLASDMTETTGPTLLVDIGTNGEIVLWANGRLTAASTAAGPAFEGARISCGMRGSAGAIEKIVADGHLRINVIGDVTPQGVCGSGLIDAAAELLRHGVLNAQGRLLDRETFLSIAENNSSLRDDLASRLTTVDGKTSFVLADAEESGVGRPIALTQRDFRELQLAAGAIRAGIVILLKRAGLVPSDLQNVYIAGGFGNFIRRSNAQRIGLLPHEIEHRRIRYLGNTSLAGAKLAAISLASRREAERIARQTEHVDLSLDPDFQNAFADAMLFPEA